MVKTNKFHVLRCNVADGIKRYRDMRGIGSYLSAATYAGRTANRYYMLWCDTDETQYIVGWYCWRWRAEALEKLAYIIP